MNQSLSLEYVKVLSKIIPMSGIQVFNNEIVLIIRLKQIIPIIRFLRDHLNCQFKLLVAISGVDHLETSSRFEINYEILSLKFNSRIRIKTYTNEITCVASIVRIHSSANWWEREIWDLYGLFFKNHPDLRRILTDYGFEGYPLRKDFPLSGYTEVRYDERQKRIVCEPLELSQEFRVFDFLSPWINSQSGFTLTKTLTV